VISGLDWTATKRADKVVVNSAFTKHHFQQAYREKAEVIYPGVDGSVYYPANHTQKGYFLFVGEKETINGFDLVQKVLERSAIPFKVRYVTLADGKFRYTSAQLNQLYQQAVATLCLSYNEPFGLSAIESMAAGTPVIAVNEGGYRESVRDKETGMLIERKAQELYTAMKYLAVETEKRKLWGTQARERVESSFTWKQHMQRLEVVLGEVIL
jgi:glycosyltransferase involved in cell wall biosynthesis